MCTAITYLSSRVSPSPMPHFKVSPSLSVFSFHFISFSESHHHSFALKLTKLVVPNVVDVKDIVMLSCSYEMGTHKLNSVKWYRNGDEFFRYAPMTYPIYKTFPVEGVYVSSEKPIACNNHDCTIYLEHLNSKTSGSYRCEVSGDAPEFKLSEGTANMTMVSFPRFNPFISGTSSSYELGDWIIANCTSDLSHPTAVLSWYINDEIVCWLFLQLRGWIHIKFGFTKYSQVANEFLHPYQEKTDETKGLKIGFNTLELRFKLDESYLLDNHHNNINSKDRKDKIRLKCVSRIDKIPVANKETTQIIYVSSAEEMTNPMLKFWRNSGKWDIFDYILFSHYIVKDIHITNIYITANEKQLSIFLISNLFIFQYLISFY